MWCGVVRCGAVTWSVWSSFTLTRVCARVAVLGAGDQAAKWSCSCVAGELRSSLFCECVHQSRQPLRAGSKAGSDTSPEDMCLPGIVARVSMLSTALMT